MGASAASHENLPFLVGWRSQAVDGPDEPECTGEHGKSLHRSGQVTSSFRETCQERQSLH